VRRINPKTVTGVISGVLVAAITAVVVAANYVYAAVSRCGRTDGC
jgi:hypothetical protein